MENNFTKKTRRKYDASFKREVVNMIAAGRSVPDIARSLGVGDNIIYRWRQQALSTSESSAVTELANGSPVSLSEYLALQKRLRELEIEHEILKKAVAIFSRPH
jgi:transposase